jgi:methenyltetrahydromethanopterin cyclohydrolase
MMRLFAGQVHIFVKGSDEAAEKLAKELPSSASKDYGKPFADIFKQYDNFSKSMRCYLAGQCR